MRIGATSVGDVAKRLLSRGSELQVREVFKTTLYLSMRNQMVVISSRGGRSPFSINVPEGIEFRDVNPGDSVSGSGASIEVGNVSVGLMRSPTYHGLGFPPFRGLKFGLGKGLNDLIRATFIVKLLYQVSGPEASLLEAPQVRAFIDQILVPVARGRTGCLYDLVKYEPVIGFGSGFTPAGDDFVAGVLYSLNGASKELKIRPAKLPPGFLSIRTPWVSSMFLRYTQRGLVEESLYSLLDAVWRGDGRVLEDSVMSLASRGHTSGLDVAVGVLLGVASIYDNLQRSSLLPRVLGVLLNN